MIKLTITRGNEALGHVDLDRQQCLWLEAYSIANECDIASMIKRAIHFAVAPEKPVERGGPPELKAPAGW